jgi:hypothetical protein
MRGALTLAAIAVVSLISMEAKAHYCSNIFSGPARFVVKPETTSLTVSGSAQLRVYLQNNFPYTLFGVQLRGVASGFTVTSSPASQTIHPGQNVSYLLTVTGTGTATMTMQMMFRVGSWRAPTDKLVNQSPTQALLVSGAVYGAGTAEQSPSLNLGKLADLYGSATLGTGAPTFSRTGMQQLIKMFGYRYCWDEGGTWIGGGQDCPSPIAEATWGSPNDTSQFPQDCMRAGVDLAVRKASLGSNLAAAQNAAVNALKGSGSSDHKCLAAVVGGYLWQGASDPSPLTAALSLAGNSVPAVCQTAALRALGTNNTAQTCPSSPFQQRAACAAGEGLRNNDGPVTSILMANAGDGASSSGSDWTSSLYYAYMLYLVQGVRRATGGVVPFYPDAGAPITGCTTPADCNDSNVCTTDTCNTTTGVCTNAPITGCCTTAAQCNDSNVCTTDACNTTTNTCTNTPITGCCTASSQCTDSNVCTTDTCNTTTHVCQFTAITGCCTTTAQCNDSNVCTTDTCNTTSNTCTHAAITGCCTTAAQCNDSNACTTDTCNTTTNTCTNAPITGCCTASAQCNDSNVCTSDTCNLTTHVCEFAPITNCCTASAQCNDNVSCTTDSCNTATNVCVFTPVAGCCTTNAQCDDSNPCTTDTCATATGICTNAPISSCCTTNAQCNDSNVCTTDTCNTTTHVCQFTPVANCCTAAAQCNDSNVCTTDTCNTTTTTCVFTPVTGCCTTNATCNDSNVCTADTCNTTSHTCQSTAISGCCTTAAQCSDGSNCTTDTCNTTTHLCEHAPVAGCCTKDADCADSNPCTDDTCNTTNKTCSNTKKAGCCAFDVDCDDSNACTLDTCDTTTNTCAHTPTCADQGVPPADAGTADQAAVAPDLAGGPNRLVLEGGCGCAVPAASPARPAGLLMLLLLPLVASRRLLSRHRRRRHGRR